MTDDVFDLDALETDGTPFPFRHGGEDYVLPPSIDLRAAVAASDGRLDEAFAMLLGDEQWARILASPALLDQAKFVKLMEAYFDHLGIKLGESVASSGSSASTGGPSKRTSKPSTALR